ncbi:MAG: acylphosphatase [Candidatus Omnitrophica bacterium]|nr:acylphosphatase [Candidatus Omnitrophota bacterium]MDE2221855.1 acylphosphatase [Candidatus Omnitrophota bacterium]
MVRAHIHFFGTVQGVGFRYTTLNLAKPLHLTGWVRNLSDGSVEAVAEGSREKIEELVALLKQEFGQFIRDIKIEWPPARGEFAEFKIVH